MTISPAARTGLLRRQLPCLIAWLVLIPAWTAQGQIQTDPPLFPRPMHPLPRGSVKEQSKERAAQDEVVRLNQIQFIGSEHGVAADLLRKGSAVPCQPGVAADSKTKSAPSLTVQLNAGMRAVELPLAGFSPCLAAIHAWSAAHPDHLPLFLLLRSPAEPLQNAIGVLPAPQASAASSPDPDAIETAVLSIIPRAGIITPDQVRGEHASLPEAITDRGWPTLMRSRGKIVVLLDAPALVARYIDGHSKLESRLMFPLTKPGMPYAAFVQEDDAPPEVIDSLVRSGYMVLSRISDVRTGSGTKDLAAAWEHAVSGGAQILEMSFPRLGDAVQTSYSQKLPGGATVRCNPVIRPAVCKDELLPGSSVQAKTPR